MAPPAKSTGPPGGPVPEDAVSMVNTLMRENEGIHAELKASEEEKHMLSVMLDGLDLEDLQRTSEVNHIDSIQRLLDFYHTFEKLIREVIGKTRKSLDPSPSLFVVTEVERPDRGRQVGPISLKSRDESGRANLNSTLQDLLSRYTGLLASCYADLCALDQRTGIERSMSLRAMIDRPGPEFISKGKIITIFAKAIERTIAEAVFLPRQTRRAMLDQVKEIRQTIDYWRRVRQDSALARSTLVSIFLRQREKYQHSSDVLIRKNEGLVFKLSKKDETIKELKAINNHLVGKLVELRDGPGPVPSPSGRRSLGSRRSAGAEDHSLGSGGTIGRAVQGPVHNHEQDEEGVRVGFEVLALAHLPMDDTEPDEDGDVEVILGSSVSVGVAVRGDVMVHEGEDGHSSDEDDEYEAAGYRDMVLPVGQRVKTLVMGSSKVLDD